MLDSQHKQRWFMTFPATSPSSATMICFPYAGGGGTAYASWAKTLKTPMRILGVQLPGRGARFLEQPSESVSEIVNGAIASLRNECIAPYFVYGHSFGALLAFEFVRQTRRENLAPPSALIVTGRSSPSWPVGDRRLDLLSREELVAELQRFNGTPRDVLANEQLMDLVLPAVRADFRAHADYIFEEEAPLDLPIIVMNGSSDQTIIEAGVDQWQRQTTHCIETFVVPGDHFFMSNNQGRFFDVLDFVLANQLAKQRPTC